MGLPKRLLAVVVLAGACTGGAPDRDSLEPITESVDGTVAATTTVDGTGPPTASTTTISVAERLPALPTDIGGAVRADDGTARPITGTDGEVWFIRGACGADAVAPATTAALIGPRHVVLDPGAGGADRGIELGGLVEAELNLDIAERTAALLRAQGVTVALTRTRDTDLSAGVRGALGPALGARALVSINVGVPVGAAAGPRPAVFHQIGDEQSRRLAGLVHEELVAAFARFDGPWAALAEPGVRPLLNQRGDDFFVVLDAGVGTPAVRVEVVAVGENEATLLSTEEGREAEAEALADALVRFLVTDEQGDGFITPTETVRTAATSNTPGGCGG